MKGKKETRKYEKRINVRFSYDEYRHIIEKAEAEHLPPSTFIRQKICFLLNGIGG